MANGWFVCFITSGVLFLLSFIFFHLCFLEKFHTWIQCILIISHSYCLLSKSPRIPHHHSNFHTSLYFLIELFTQSLFSAAFMCMNVGPSTGASFQWSHSHRKWVSLRSHELLIAPPFPSNMSAGRIADISNYSVTSSVLFYQPVSVIHNLNLRQSGTEISGTFAHVGCTHYPFKKSQMFSLWTLSPLKSTWSCVNINTLASIWHC